MLPFISMKFFEQMTQGERYPPPLFPQKNQKTLPNNCYFLQLLQPFPIFRDSQTKSSEQFYNTEHTAW